jgi:hypothetical protein
MIPGMAESLGVSIERVHELLWDSEILLEGCHVERTLG